MARVAMWQRLRGWARHLKSETLVLWFCCKHPATPLAAKILATVVVAYALSPIDLIPDFIPVIGYLDDVILVPAGIYLAMKLIPQPVIAECRLQAAEWLAVKRAKLRNYAAAAVILLVWIAVLWFAWRWFNASN